MSLKLQKENEIPKNAVILTKSEAIEYQWKQILDWKPQSDIWPYKHGLGILGTVAGLSGMYINFKFRKAMKFRNFGGFASIMPTSMCPGLLAGIFQMEYVAAKTFLPSETCPLCIELRSIVIQNATAILYPAILAPLTNFMLAMRGQTHRIPHYKNWRDLLFFCGNLYKPMLPSLALISVVNSIIASFILHKQINSLSYVREVLNLESEDEQNVELFDN